MTVFEKIKSIKNVKEIMELFYKHKEHSETYNVFMDVKFTDTLRRLMKICIEKDAESIDLIFGKNGSKVCANITFKIIKDGVKE